MTDILESAFLLVGLVFLIGAVLVTLFRKPARVVIDEYERDAFDNYTPKRQPDDPGYDYVPPQGRLR